MDDLLIGGMFCLSLSFPTTLPPPTKAESKTEVYVQVGDLGNDLREQERDQDCGTSKDKVKAGCGTL